jgi:hypothetical protein
MRLQRKLHKNNVRITIMSVLPNQNKQDNNEHGHNS